MTLPGVLAALSAGRADDFPRVRPHQFHPWCMFLTQLAAHACHDSPVLPTDEGGWRQRLEVLVGGNTSAFALVEPDLSKPAFMQPPVPEGALAKKDGKPWDAIDSPDALDLLVTAKSHDVKQHTIHSDDIEAWVYAFVSVQTGQGYPGRGYNGVARMNGGYGNRPRVGLAAGIDVSSRFHRDLRILQSSASSLVERGFAAQGVRLVWLAPWDGQTSLAVQQLAPHFIEVCQRLRAVQTSDGIAVLRSTSAASRCAPEIEKGDVGDVWIPIKKEDAAAFTAGPDGFSYEKAVALLMGGEFKTAPAAEFQQDDGDVMWWMANALSRGQGKTEGLHERVIRIARARKMFAPQVKDQLAARAKGRIEQASLMRSKVLYPALKQLAPAGTTPSDVFSAEVDRIFFDDFFAAVELDDQAARLQWEKRLLQIARSELARLVEVATLSQVGRYRLMSDAWRMLEGCARKHFPDAKAAEAVLESTAALTTSTTEQEAT